MIGAHFIASTTCEYLKLNRFGLPSTIEYHLVVIYWDFSLPDFFFVDPMFLACSQKGLLAVTLSLQVYLTLIVVLSPFTPEDVPFSHYYRAQFYKTLLSQNPSSKKVLSKVLRK